jgi:hypothetical protein
MSNQTKAAPLTSQQLPQVPQVQLQPKSLTGHSRIPTSAFTPVNNLPQEIKSEAKAKDPVIVTGLNDKVKELDPDTHLRRPATAERAPFAISRSQSLSQTTTTTNNTTTTTSMAHTQRHHHQHQQRQHMPSSPDTSAILSPSPTPMTTPIPTPTPTPTPEMVSPPHDGVIHDAKKRHTQHHQQQQQQQQRPLAKLKTTNATPPTTAHVASTHPPALTAKKHSNCKTIEADCTIIHNPIKKDILKINEENYYLKLEVIRLVSTLKGLREVSTLVSSSTSTSPASAPSPVPSPAQPIPSPNLKSKSKSKTKPTSSKPRETAPRTTITPTSTPTITTSTTTTKPVGTSVSITKKVPGTVKTAVNAPELTFRTNCNATATATSDATQNSTHIPTTQPTRKRCHDDDINDLIVSLVDLSHSQVGTPVAEEHTTLSAASATVTATATATATVPAAIVSRNTTADRTTKLKSDPYLDTAPVSDADDFDLDLDLDLNVDIDVDADDILSTVSTTPSTMFSLSLSGTNDTIDVVSSGSTSTNIWKTMEDIEEIPPFELLELPNEKSIQSGRMDVRMNYDTGISTTKGKFQMLDTFSVITAMEERDHDDHDQEQDEEEVGSLRLMRYDNGPPEVPDLDLNFNFNFNDAMDVDHEFANFVDGKGF